MSLRTASISQCGRYRYSLWRDVADGELEPGVGTVAFIMLNPSTADATQDDPTIRRCVSFARSWGYQRLGVGNLFAIRATDPNAISEADDPFGPLNDHAQDLICSQADMIVCAWGAWNGTPRGAAERFRRRFNGYGLRHLGLTKGGHPRHPLYLRSDTKPELWQ